MFSTIFALVLATSVGASRVQIHEADQAKFGASCDDLQNTFRSRLVTFRGFLDANPDLDAISRMSRTRALMRTYGIIRTLRRARTCSWVVDNDSEELEEARSIVQSLLSGNPCADAARSELEAGASAESGELGLRSIHRAMVILSSDDCEAAEPPEETENGDENVESQLATAEDGLQDVIEELEDSAGSALVQTEDGTVRGFFRAIGVAFLMLILLLACVGAIAIIGTFIVSIILALMAGIGGRVGFLSHWRSINTGMTPMYHTMRFGALAGVVAIAPCASQLYSQLL